MKTQVFLVALLCVSAALANPLSDPKDEEPVTDSQLQCITDQLSKLETDLESAGELGSDALETLQRLRDHRNRCEAILGDPPTALQERMRETCRLAWSASVAYELNRLRGQSTLIDGTITAVQECRA